MTFDEWWTRNAEWAGVENRVTHERCWSQARERWTPPPCDACGGLGFVMVSHSFPGGGGLSNGPCPKGCPPMQTFNATPAFIQALENPPAPNDRLRAAFERHSNEVDSRD